MGDIGRSRCWIRLGGHDIELRIGQTLVGRHDSCHIVLDDALASRRHALIHFGEEGVSVEDLGSVNGVLVNSRRIRKNQALTDGDEIKLGNQTMIVHVGGKASARPARHRVGATTLARLSDGMDLGEDEQTIVRDEATLGVLAGAGAKALRLGNGEQAEALVSKSLHRMMDHVRSGRRVDSEAIELAATQAIRLAQATKKRDWIDYPIEMYSHLDRVMPGPIVELLYEAVRQVPDFDSAKLRGYVVGLQSQQDVMTPAERFLLRRIEGLLARLSS